MEFSGSVQLFSLEWHLAGSMWFKKLILYLKKKLKTKQYLFIVWHYQQQRQPFIWSPQFSPYVSQSRSNWNRRGKNGWHLLCYLKVNKSTSLKNGKEMTHFPTTAWLGSRVWSAFLPAQKRMSVARAALPTLFLHAF